MKEQIAMAEKFRKNVAVPEELAKKLRKFIEKKKVVKTVKERRQKREAAGVKDKNARFVDAAGVFGLGTVKWSAWLTAGGAQFLLTLARWLTMDNAFLRKMEKNFSDMTVGKNKKGKPKKVSSFAKKYPNLSAHILWLLGLTAVSGAGYVTAKYEQEIDHDYKEWKLDSEEKKAFSGTYKAFLERIKPITPVLIADLIVKEGVHINENGMHTPYRDSKGIPTIGFGSTVLKDGTKVTMSTPPITDEEAYELARWHLENETFFVLYCYDVSQDNVHIETTSEALGIGSVVYNAYSKLIEVPEDSNHKNRFDKLRNLYKEYGYALPDSLVKQCFDVYPVRKPRSFGEAWLSGSDKNEVANKLGGFLAGGKGMYWRRWLEAGLMTGDITPQMLLNCPINGMYEFFSLMGKEKSAFFESDVFGPRVNKKTYKVFKEWLKNPRDKKGKSLKNWKKVSDYLPDDALLLCQSGKCVLGNNDFVDYYAKTEKISTVKTYTIGYDDLYENAMLAYSKKDYKSAADQLENMLKSFPDNALLHNDLAATYNNLGLYEKAIKCAREILTRIGDKSQYAAAQYNAGFAYEQIGDLERALKNYKLSVRNGNIGVKKDIKRVNKLLRQKEQNFVEAAKRVNGKSKAFKIRRRGTVEKENIA